MRPGCKPLAAALLAALLLAAPQVHLRAAPACDKPVYLTFDTGHMAVAPLVAEVLQRHGVKVTFFLANEPTKTGGTSLDDVWAPWWRARAAEGHAFGSHTWNHPIWLADLPGRRFRMKPTAGPQAGQVQVLDEAALRIVKLAAPYAVFPESVQRDTDIIEITRTWSFTSADQLRTN